MTRFQPIRFIRGRHLYHITSAPTGTGYVGMCDGRVVTRALAPAQVARVLIQSPANQRESK